MKSYRLDGMKENAVAFDLETHIMQPGLLAPPIVLGSASELGPHGVQGVLLGKQSARAVFRTILDNPYVVVCVANGAFDFLCMTVDAAKLGEDLMPKIFDMYDPGRTIVRGHCDGRVFETLLAEPLHAIAQGHLGKHALTDQPILSDAGRKGRYKLRNIVQEVLNREDAKTNDQFRLMYAQFDDMPLENLPFEARQYPVDDTNNTLESALAQAGHLPSVNMHEWVQGAQPGYMYCRHCQRPHAPETPQACMRMQRRRNLGGLAQQAYFAWAAHLGAAWGLNINQEMVDELEREVDAQRDASIAPFKAAGIIRDDDTENQATLKKLVAIAYGARDICTECNGDGKVPSPKTAGKTKINCAACDGTGLALPRSVPRAPAGGVKKDQDTLQESGNELLVAYGEQPSKKIKSTYIPLMRKGRACNVCGFTGVKTKYKPAHAETCTAQNGEAGYRVVPLCPSIDVLKETERSAVEDGIHGLPRKGITARDGRKLSVRACFEARKGYVLSSEDYTAGELVTLAWNCIKFVGYSKLAEVLNKGIDAHLMLAGTMLGKSYDEMLVLKKAHDPVATDTRQATKAANFGFGGGMAEVTFVLKKRSDPDCFTPCKNGPTENAKGVRGYDGLRLCILIGGFDRCGYVMVHDWKDKPTPAPLCKHCLEAAVQLREFWFKQWPEMKPYFDKVKHMLRDDGPSGTPEVVYPDDGLVRGGMGFCDAANGFFQRKLAKASKAAYCQVQREFCDRTVRVENSEMMTSRFAGGPSPLLGAGRALLNFHDEAICEHVESVAHEGAHRVSEIFVETLRFACPELAPAVKADPCLMRRLLKGAEARWLRGGDKPADENDRLVPYEE